MFSRLVILLAFCSLIVRFIFSNSSTVHNIVRPPKSFYRSGNILILPNCEVTRNFEEKPHTAVHLLSSSTAKCTSAAQYSVVAAEKRRGGHVESKNENIVICSIVYVHWYLKPEKKYTVSKNKNQNW